MGRNHPRIIAKPRQTREFFEIQRGRRAGGWVGGGGGGRLTEGVRGRRGARKQSLSGSVDGVFASS